MACRADTNFVTAQSQTVTNQFEAYAQVESIAVLPVRVAQAGLVGGLEIVPGAAVQAGQKLAELGGPEIQALLAQDEAAVSSARQTCWRRRNRWRFSGSNSLPISSPTR